MTAVTEPKKAKKKAETEVLDNGTVVITEVEETATDGQEASALPPPAPGEPGFDWSEEYPGEKVFTYTTDDGVLIGIAAISKKRQPSIGFLRKTRRKPEFEQTLDMLEFVASDAALALTDEWTAEELIVMWNAWSEWNQTNAGE